MCVRASHKLFLSLSSLTTLVLINAQKTNTTDEEQLINRVEMLVQPGSIGLMFGLFVDRMQVVSETDATISFDGTEIVSSQCHKYDYCCLAKISTVSVVYRAFSQIVLK